MSGHRQETISHVGAMVGQIMGISLDAVVTILKMASSGVGKGWQRGQGPVYDLVSCGFFFPPFFSLFSSLGHSFVYFFFSTFAFFCRIIWIWAGRDGFEPQDIMNGSQVSIEPSKTTCMHAHRWMKRQVHPVHAMQVVASGSGPRENLKPRTKDLTCTTNLLGENKYPDSANGRCYVLAHCVPHVPSYLWVLECLSP